MPETQRDLFADAGSQPASPPQPPAAEPASRPASRTRKVEAPAPRSTRISSPVLAALRGAVVGHDHVDLGAQQLPRSVYLEAAAVLETIGAKWHTGRKRHLFTQTWDPGMFADVLETGEAPPANPLAYFATPRPVAEDLLSARQVTDVLHTCGSITVLEPSAGTGALALTLAEIWAKWAAEIEDPTRSRGDRDRVGAHGGRRRVLDAGGSSATASGGTVRVWRPTRLRLVMVEMDERRAKILRARIAPQIAAMHARITVEVVVADFLTITPDKLGRIDLVAMNPPFSLPGDKAAWWTHLQHAIALADRLRGAVACIVPPAFRYQERGGMLEALATITRATAWPFPAGAFKQSGTEIATWGVALSVREAIDDGEPLPTDQAEIMIQSTRHLANALEEAYRVQKAWGPPKHEDATSSWRKSIKALTRAVALGEDDPNPRNRVERNGDPVSFAEEWQQRLSRACWQRVSEDA